MTDFDLNQIAIERGIALSGGGVGGLFSASALGYLEEKSGRKLFDDVKLFAGTSIGGILAIALANDVPPTKLIKLFREKSKKIFGNPARLNWMKLRTTKHDPRFLKEVIAEVLGDIANKDITCSKRDVLVSAVDAHKNEIVWFSNIAGDENQVFRQAKIIDVAMATSAAPTYFPPHEIDGEFFLDGGIASNSPDLEALNFLAWHQGKPLESIRILSIGTGKTTFPKRFARREKPGGIAWLHKHRIIERLMNLQDSKSSAIAENLLGDRYCRINSDLDFSIDLDDYGKATLDHLESAGRKTAAEEWERDTARLANFVR